MVGSTVKCASWGPEERAFRYPEQRGLLVSSNRGQASFIPCGLAWTTCQEAQSQTLGGITNSQLKGGEAGLLFPDPYASLSVLSVLCPDFRVGEWGDSAKL